MLALARTYFPLFHGAPLLQLMLVVQVKAGCKIYQDARLSGMQDWQTYHDALTIAIDSQDVQDTRSDWQDAAP